MPWRRLALAALLALAPVAASAIELQPGDQLLFDYRDTKGQPQHWTIVPGATGLLQFYDSSNPSQGLSFPLGTAVGGTLNAPTIEGPTITGTVGGGADYSTGNVTATPGTPTTAPPSTQSLAGWMEWVASGGGAVPAGGLAWQPLATIAGRVFSVDDSGAKGNGVTDDTAAFQSAITACGTNGIILLGRKQYLVNSASLSFPTGCSVVGQGSWIINNTTTPFTAKPAILLNPAYSLTFNAPASGFSVINSTIAAPTSSRAAITAAEDFSGTGVILASGGRLDDIQIIGFGTGLKVTATEYSLHDLQIDSTTCIDVAAGGNWSWINRVSCHPYAGITFGSISQTITGAADNGFGAIRLTMASTAALVASDPAIVTGVGGFTGANWPCTVTIVDSTHVDCAGSASSPSTTATFTSGSTVLHLASVTNIGVGQTLTGFTGIPSGDAVAKVFPQASAVSLTAATTASETAESVTFVNPAYTSGGKLQVSVTRRAAPAISDAGDAGGGGIFIRDFGEYGHEYGVEATNGARPIFLNDFSCDADPLSVAPTDTCVSITGATKSFQWNGGQLYSPTLAGLYWAPTASGGATGSIRGVSPMDTIEIGPSGNAGSLTIGDLSMVSPSDLYLDDAAPYTFLANDNLLGTPITTDTISPFSSSSKLILDAATRVSGIGGSWTPVDGSVAGLVFSSVVARWEFFGRVAQISFTLTYPTTADSNNAKIGGLPVNPNAAAISIPAACNSNMTTPLGLHIQSGFAFPINSSTNASYTNANLSGTTITCTATYSTRS
jgi:hypothetical protein